jgi:hypothetical protein
MAPDQPNLPAAATLYHHYAICVDEHHSNGSGLTAVAQPDRLVSSRFVRPMRRSA